MNENITFKTEGKKQKKTKKYNMEKRTQFHYNTGIIFDEMSLFSSRTTEQQCDDLKKMFHENIDVNILKNQRNKEKKKNRPDDVDNGHIK